MKNLVYRNMWENDEYWVDGKLVQDITKVSINGIEYPVFSRMITVPYNDMGHTYSSRSKHYFVESRDLGVDVDLNRVVHPHFKNDVVALEYVVKE